MPRVDNPEPVWPAVQDIHILSTENFDTLSRNDLIEGGRRDYFGPDYNLLKVNGGVFVIPKILTSRYTLSCMGFTNEVVEEIWAYVNNPRSATCTKDYSLPPNRGSEFWGRIEKWLDDRILHITNTPHLNPHDSSPELLDRLGLRNDTQNQYHKLNLPPIMFGCYGGFRKFTLAQIIDLDVLPWAKKVLTRRWNAMETLEFCIFRGGNEINKLGWADLVNELTQRPIDSDLAYISDPYCLLSTEVPKLRYGF